MKPKLLVLELWGLGDLALAAPFLRAASQRFEVTLLAKPVALDLQQRLWPGVRVISFAAPWTAFTGKYRLWQWPWRTIFSLRRALAGERFDIAVSARWDPRDHFLQRFTGAKQRLGYPRLFTQLLLTQPLTRPKAPAHRYEYWRGIAQALGLSLPARDALPVSAGRSGEAILVHSGAAQPVREWPLERYHKLVSRLREMHCQVVVACDTSQRAWWLQAGESDVATPAKAAELIALLDRSRAFIGNDSGPGHLAAICGVPTFTLFGPQLPELFAPIHPVSTWVEGKPCPYKPCSDHCHFAKPHCLLGVTEDEVWAGVEKLIRVPD